MNKKRIDNLIRTFIMLMTAGIYCAPLLFILFDGPKNEPQLPASPVFSDFTHLVTVWRSMHFPDAFFNTVLIMAAGTAGIILMGAMAAYALQRIRFKGSRLFYLFFIFALLIPFPAFMIPLVSLTGKLRLTGIMGIIPVYWSLGCPLAIFLLYGFIKKIPLCLEEAATMEGAGPLMVFFKIVFPLLKPMITVIMILDVFWIWNDFLLPLIFLEPNQATLQLAQYNFFKQFRSIYRAATACLVLSSLPAVLFYLFARKKYIKSMAAGVIKSRIS